MSVEEYSYLDFAVMPFARRKVISADAAIVFDEKVNHILWANAAGTELFASGLVIDLISSSISHNHPLVSQILNAAKQLSDNEPVVRSFRIAQGLKTLSLKGSVKFEMLPDGSKVIMLTITSWTASKNQAEHLLAENAVNSLDGFADASAIVDEFGLPIASSSQFDEMDVLPANLQKLVAETSNETDRMVKRQISSETGTSLAAGIGRIHDLPARYIIVLANLDEELTQETKLVDEPSIASSLPHGDMDPLRDVAPPWEIENPSDSLHSELDKPQEQQSSLLDRWYFKADDLEPSDKDLADTAATNSSKFSESLEEAEQGNTEFEPSKPEQIEDLASEKSVRFAFSIGPDQIFRTVSPELEEVVGQKSANIVDRHWSEIAQHFGFDENGAISRLLEKADTWSGKSVLWPVENTDMAMPVDLAALPIFDRDRTFDGFRGFGIIRTGDAIVDPDAKGMHLDDRFAELSDKKSSEPVRHDEDDWDTTREPQPIKEDDNQPLETEHRLGFKSDLSDEDVTANDTPSNIISLHGDKEIPSNTMSKGLDQKDANTFDDIRQSLAKEGVEVSETTTEVSERTERISDENTSVLSKFDSPVLIYKSDKTLFANQELLEMAGYDSLDDLKESGGIDHLLDGTVDGSDQNSLQLKRKDGSSISVKPILKKVEWEGTSAMCLSFEEFDTDQTAVSLPEHERSALDMVRVSDLESILDTATDGILVLTSDGEIEALNASGEALFGKNQADVIGTKFYDLFAKESKKSLQSYFKDLKDPSQTNLMNNGREVIGVESSGGMIPIFATLGSIGNSGNFCMVLRDLTERKKSEEELVTAKRAAETASEQKSEFLARISHEIREPLNSIIGFSDIMIEERFGPVENERYAEYMRHINRSGVHVLDLVNDLLDISKIEAGKLELSYEAVDLNQLAAETVALLQPKANDRRIIIRTSLSRALPKVVADSRSVRQIIMNLASNAIHHSPSNSQVIVSTTYESNGEVGLRVRDTGNGMNQKQMEMALEPFSQIKDSNMSSTSGTGLGLPLTKALVEANRAYFELESTIGEGTIAFVQFPTQRVLAD